MGTVLANDEVKDGLSVRGGFPVEQKKMKQWQLRVSAYAERLLEGLGLHDIRIGCAIVKGIDALFDPFLIDVFDELQAVLLHGFIAEADHFLELPRRIDMEERERRLFRIKGLEGQVKHDRTVLADRIEHDRLFTFRGNFADDVNRLGL